MSAAQAKEVEPPAETMADAEAIIDHLISGRPLDPVIARRTRERGDQIREEILQTHGILNIGVAAIRELRDRE